MNKETPSELQENKFVDFLFEELVKSNVKPEIFTSEEKRAEIKQDIHQLLVKFDHDISLGATLLHEKALPEEQDAIDRVLTDFVDSQREHSNQEFLEDGKKLVTIASRELGEGHFQDAEAMFCFILHLFPMLGSAWSGLAASAYALGKQEQADLLFSLGVNTLPKNYFLLLQAAYFYLSSGQQEKIPEVLDKIYYVLSFEQDPACIAYVSDEIKKFHL